MIAARQPPPPITMPAAAPTLVSRRHQMPSTISGQNEEAAMANAQPTSRASEKRLTSRAVPVAIAPAARSRTSRNEVTPPLHEVMRQRARDADQQAG